MSAYAMETLIGVALLAGSALCFIYCTAVALIAALTAGDEQR